MNPVTAITMVKDNTEQRAGTLNMPCLEFTNIYITYANKFTFLFKQFELEFL